MCGLSGAMSSSLSWQEEGIFKDLLNISSLRGYEGSGVIISQKQILKRNPLIRSLRTPFISGALANSPELAELFRPSCNIAIGHARWPTKGGTDIKAVHPHRSGHIVGVHNGTMNRVAGVDVKDQSDSAMLFESIAKIGVAETIKESSGAYALVWIDEQKQTVNFLRNGQRTLYFKNVGWNKNINTLYWASEQSMLDFVFKRTYKGDNTWDTFLPIDTWFEYPMDVRHMIQPQEVTKDIKPKAISYPATGYYGNRSNHSRFQSALFEDAEDLPWQRFSASGVEENNVLRLPPPKDDKPLSKQAKKRLAKQEALEAARMKKEAALNNKALLEFRKRTAENTADKYVPADSSVPKDITSALSDLHDDMPDLGGTLYVQFEGKECAWCGSVACVGDRVVPVNASDLGDKTFICIDCSRNPDVAEFIEGCEQATVSP